MGTIHKFDRGDGNSTSPSDLAELQSTFRRAKKDLYDADGILNRKLFRDTLDAFGIISKFDRPALVEEIYDLLNSSDDIIRSEAVATLGFTTRFHLPEFCDKAYDILAHDQSDEVKSTAIIAWCSYYYKTNNPFVLKQLYNILKNESNDIQVRTCAFCGICEVITDAFPGYDRYTSSLPLMECNIAEEFNSKIDWNEVERIINKYVPPEMRTEK